MKVLHTSDWHLGITISTKSMLKDQEYFFEQLYRIIEEKDVDVVICAGDVYDNSVSNADSLKLYDKVMTHICMDMGRKVLVIAGNHDGAERLATNKELLKKSGLYVSGRISPEFKIYQTDEVDFYAIPFFNKDEVINLFPDKKEEIINSEKAMQVVCDYIREGMNPDKKNILISHSMIVNAELSDSDRSAKIGQAFAISKDVFEGFDYVALGHIHKPQDIGDRIRYSGTPMKYSFGSEEKQEKSVTIIDTDSMDREIVPLKELHGRVTFSGTYEEIMEDKDKLKDSYLKLTVTDRNMNRELQTELYHVFPYLSEVYGMSDNFTGKSNNLTVEELNSLDETDIMIRYMEESYGAKPEADQIEFFKATLNELNEKGVL